MINPIQLKASLPSKHPPYSLRSGPRQLVWRLEASSFGQCSSTLATTYLYAANLCSLRHVVRSNLFKKAAKSVCKGCDLLYSKSSAQDKSCMRFKLHQYKAYIVKNGLSSKI